MGKNILKFPEEGLKQLQFFMEGLSFPVAVAAYSEQDIGKLSYLIRLLQRGWETILSDSVAAEGIYP